MIPTEKRSGLDSPLIEAADFDMFSLPVRKESRNLVPILPQLPNFVNARKCLILGIDAILSSVQRTSRTHLFGEVQS